MEELSDEEREHYRQEADNPNGIFTGLFGEEYDEEFAKVKHDEYLKYAETGVKEKMNPKALQDFAQSIVSNKFPVDVEIKDIDMDTFNTLNEYYQTLTAVHLSPHALAKAKCNKYDEWMPSDFKKEVTDFMVSHAGMDPSSDWSAISMGVRQAFMSAEKKLNVRPEDVTSEMNKEVYDAVYEHYGLGELDFEEEDAKNLLMVNMQEQMGGAKPNRAMRRKMAKANKKKKRRR